VEVTPLMEKCVKLISYYIFPSLSALCCYILRKFNRHHKRFIVLYKTVILMADVKKKFSCREFGYFKSIAFSLSSEKTSGIAVFHYRQNEQFLKIS